MWFTRLVTHVYPSPIMSSHNFTGLRLNQVENTLGLNKRTMFVVLLRKPQIKKGKIMKEDIKIFLIRI